MFSTDMSWKDYIEFLSSLLEKIAHYILDIVSRSNLSCSFISLLVSHITVTSCLVLLQSV